MDARDKSELPKCSRCGQLAEESASPEIEHPFRAFLLRVYCRVMIVLILYVLSTGPLYWPIFEAFNNRGSAFLAELYLPIAYACDQNDTICDWFDWYAGLWVY